MVIGLDLALDGLGAMMLLLVVGVGIAVALHAHAYLRDPATRRRVLVLLALFACAMSLLVVADDLLLLYLAWEATSVLSFLLIGTKQADAGAREAARRALATTGAGGIALLVGLIVAMQSTGARTVTGLLDAGLDGGAGTAAAALMLVGALSKSAQVPFHGWLPGAMAAPAPISAYLHSATMVKAGVFLIARLSPAFSEVPTWEVVLLSGAIGGVVVGGVRAVLSDDLKALFAWSTVSQLGFLIVLVSSPKPKVVLAGMGLLVAHAAAKAALFLSVGSVETAFKTRSLAALSGMGRTRPVMGASITVALASLSGVAPTYGFISKEAALVGLLDSPDPVRMAAVVGGSVLTAIYSARVIAVMWARPATLPTATPTFARLTWTPAALAAAALGLGLAWPLGHRVAALGATAIAEKAGDKPLVLWGGLNQALLISLVSVAVGGAIGLLHHRRITAADGMAGAATTARLPGWLRRVDATAAVLDAPVRAGKLAIHVLRPGALRPTVGVVLIGAAAAVLLPALGLPERLEAGAGRMLGYASSPMAGLALVTVMAGAFGAALIRQRFAAVLALGVVGFAMSGWFVLIGAPDLALTQALVEMVVVLAFLLVLRRLPDLRVRDRDRVPTRSLLAVRAGIAGAAGLAAGAMALLVTQQTRLSPLAQEILGRSYTEGKGRNAVNVILTDVRALDTFGEVAVIAVAALGAARLFNAGARAARRREAAASQGGGVDPERPSTAPATPTSGGTP